MLIYHRFSDRILSADAEIVIVGTFNPETPENKADFFYGRQQNYLWKLLPEAFGRYSLKNSTKEEKALFMTQHKIEFIDLIKAVDVEKPGNYRDDYIDSNVIEWTNVVDELKQLPGLRKVCVTRKTFSGVPNIRKQLQEIEAYCEHNKIRFQYLITPARGYTTQKQEAWNMCFRE